MSAVRFMTIDLIPLVLYTGAMRVRIDLDLGGILRCTGTMLYVLVTGIVLFSAALLMADGVRFPFLICLILGLMAVLIVPAMRYIIRVFHYDS